MKRLLALLVLSSIVGITAAKDDIEKDFVNPPDSVKPHTWWHWLNGNVSREGSILTWRS